MLSTQLGECFYINWLSINNLENSSPTHEKPKKQQQKAGEAIQQASTASSA